MRDCAMPKRLAKPFLKGNYLPFIPVLRDGLTNGSIFVSGTVALLHPFIFDRRRFLA
jgi:hypothetical protein